MIVINYNILHRIGGFKCMYDVNRSNIKKKKKHQAQNITYSKNKITQNS